MLDPATIPDVPPAELRFRRHVSLLGSVADLVRRREVVRSLADRDFRARYKQAFLGVGWAVIQPLILVVIFSVTIRHVAHVSTQGVPYAVWSYVGLFAWTFFSGAVTWAANCLLSNQPLLNKVNCPREAFPTAAVALAGLDAAVSLIGGILVFLVVGFLPTAEIYWAPLLLLVEIVFTLGVCMLVSVIVVYVRDLRQIIPILVQVGLFATPVAYNITDRLSPGWRYVYCALDPLAPVIDNLRRTVLFGLPPQWSYVGVGAASSVVVLAVAFRVFKKLEAGIADLL